MASCSRRKLLGWARKSVFHCSTRCVRRVFLCGKAPEPDEKKINKLVKDRQRETDAPIRNLTEITIPVSADPRKFADATAFAISGRGRFQYNVTREINSTAPLVRPQ